MTKKIEFWVEVPRSRTVKNLFQAHAASAIRQINLARSAAMNREGFVTVLARLADASADLTRAAGFVEGATTKRRG